MKINFTDTLFNLLKQESSFLDYKKELAKNKVVEVARNKNNEKHTELLKLLLSNETVKNEFFYEIDGITVFDREHFTSYMKNKNFLNDSFTKFDQQIGFNIKDKMNDNVVLNWAYKDCILEGGQSSEEKGKNEIFFNEILAKSEISRLLEPKALTNLKRVSGENKEQKLKEFKKNDKGEITDNLLIKGNNLLALHSLKEKFAGRVKLIYIDPPYNTRNDGFKYNDSFTHSTWLTFMKNRLEVAKELLRDDGVIFVQCDDNEQAYLKVMMDDILGRENTETMIWHKVGDDSGRLKITKRFRREHEYIVLGYKNKNKTYFNKYLSDRNYKNSYTNPDNDLRGVYKQGIISHTEEISKKTGKNFYDVKTPSGRIVSRQWRVTEKEFEELRNDNRIYFGKKGDSIPSLKVFINEKKETTPVSILSELGTAKSAGINLIKLFDTKLFNYPKPENYLKRIIEISTKPKDIVLDFFAGSGTTPAVAHKMGRQWIAIEQMDYIETITKKRLEKVIDGEQGGISKAVSWSGGGDFVYCELAEYNQRFETMLKTAKTKEEVVNIFNEICKKGLPKYSIEIKELSENIEQFKEYSLEEMQKRVYNILEKNMLYIPVSLMKDTDYKMNENDISLTENFYKK